MERAVDAMNKLSNNHTLVNVLLSGCFGLLCMRSLNQQHQIAALEAQKESLSATNKTIKKTLWDWKQHLLSDADDPNSPLPISTIRAIYGDSAPSTATLLTVGGTQKGVQKTQAPGLLI